MVDSTLLPELQELGATSTKFRDLVNEPRLHRALFQDKEKFNRTCSAMDVIDDVLFALNSYKSNQHDDQGTAYLEIYGVLQALTIQQDAVRELHSIIVGGSLNLEASYPEVRAIRDIRVKAAGHPVSGKNSSHFIVRHSVGKWGFELWSFDGNGNQTKERVNLRSLISNNTDALDSALRGIISWID